jgi:ribonucleoside-diphosphate reductase alpha chain
MDKRYTYSEVFEASLEYFDGDELAAKVFVDKYALRDHDNMYLEYTPTDMHRRVAREFARVENKYQNPMSEDEIFMYMDKFKYICPQGSPLSGIGNKFQLQSLGNCFVLEPPYDSYGGICKTDQELSQLMKRRGGVGLNISNLRPKGMVTKNAAKTTDGIAVFMNRFSNTCREVAQHGRRGAELQAISIKHPEIRTFINIKKDKTKVTGANLSVQITDDFMRAVELDDEFLLQFPVDSDNPEFVEKISARELWGEIINNAWECAEPGILFWDNVIKNSTADIYAEIDPAFKTTATNPCGELPLGKDSCRLLLVNLFSFVDNPFQKNATFNYNKFYDVAMVAQRLMDDLVDLEIGAINKILKKISSDPEPGNVKKIEKDLWLGLKQSCKKGRRTGLGITALGDTLAALNIKYGSKKSISTTEEIYKTLALGAHKSSCILAKERGAFPLFDFDLENSSECPYLNRIWEADPEIKKLSKKYGRRNIALTTTAPAGSISILTQTTSGIEPVFKLTYTRRKKIHPSDDIKPDFVDATGDRWKEFNIYHHKYQMWKDISGKNGIEESPYAGATAADVDWVNKVRMQAAAQKWVSHSISNTTNVPKETTKETIEKIYMEAWKSGCKGVTVYRDGCRDGVLVSSPVCDKKDGRPGCIAHTEAPKRPKELLCEIHNAVVDGIKWTILIGFLNTEPYEMFMGELSKFKIPNKCTSGKIVKCKKKKYNLVAMDNELIIDDIVETADNDDSAWITRVMSMALRHGIPVEYIVDQLAKDGSIVDVNHVLSRLLRKYIKNRDNKGEKCPQCGGHSIIYTEGCKKCECGWTGCG